MSAKRTSGGRAAVPQPRIEPDAVQTLAAAFEEFTRSTQVLEQSYRSLSERVRTLDGELAEKNRELAVTTDYLNSILDSMSDGVIAVNTDGVVTTYNRAASAVLGYAAEEVVGRPFREVFLREFAVSPGRHVMEMVAKDRRTVTVSERDSPMRDRDNALIGSVKVFQDLTEIEELRKQVRRRDRLAAIGEMAATVAHEIRNPLGGIRGFAALLARDVSDDENASRLVNKILTGTRDLERVVSELLEYTRPLELRLRRARCADLVDAALGYLRVDTDRIRLSNNVPTDLEVLVDPDRIRQVLLNILLNAVQSIDESGEVRVESECGDTEIAVIVRDTGAGIPAERLDRVFTPFYTTKEKGTGLGLAVAAKIVEAHGGRVEAASEPGMGATFRVFLNRAR